LIVLYLVYWRGHRRAASLDTVVKLFAVGKCIGGGKFLLCWRRRWLYPPGLGRGLGMGRMRMASKF
jgi:hypothetical protein